MSRLMKLIQEVYPDTEFIMASGYEDCIIGVAEEINKPPRLILSALKIIEKLTKEMGYDKAIEYFDYNVAGSYVENGPIISHDEFMPTYIAEGKEGNEN